jgi:hypothetical protein
MGQQCVVAAPFSVPAQPQPDAVRLLEEPLGFTGVGEADLPTGRLFDFRCECVDVITSPMGGNEATGLRLNPRYSHHTPVL